MSTTSTLLNRRTLLAATAGGTLLSLLPRSAHAQARPVTENGIDWYDVKDWGVEGRGWNETARYFDRYPSRAEKSIRPPVWSLSRHSAGMLVRFETDARTLHARYSLLSSSLAMPHMPATGVSGLDLYAQDERGRDRWLAVVQPRAQQVEVKMVDGVDAGTRRYTVYLPLYNGVEELRIGVPSGAAFRSIAPRQRGALLFYGTSIMHGACASRPGMAIPAILGRRFDRPTVNLGFSGNGQMEPEVVALLAELDPSVYIIDTLPNMTPELVAERTVPLVTRLREKRADTPILLVEDRTFTSAPFFQGMRQMHDRRRDALRNSYERLRKADVKGLHYLTGDQLLGDDSEGATDGSHPNDLGFMRYSDAYEKVLKPILR